MCTGYFASACLVRFSLFQCLHIFSACECWSLSILLQDGQVLKHSPKLCVFLQMIMVQEGDVAPEAPEYRHGLTPAMRDARRRRFRREPDINVSCSLVSASRKTMT